MDRNTTSQPRISVIIPVYNEEIIINETIATVRRLDENIEIVVADGGLGHTTLSAIKDQQTIKVESPPGRGRQMNAGAAVANGDIFLFLHADTVLPDRAFPAIAETIGRGIEAGAFRLSIDSSRLSLAVISWFANLRSSWERVPYGDQAQFILADRFRAMGGFADIPIMEDVELFKRIRMEGLPITILQDTVKTSPRRWEREGPLRRTLTNWWLRIQYAFGVSPVRLANHYRPHKDDTEK